MFGNWFNRKPRVVLEEYHPVWSDDSYENGIAEQDRIDRAWGEDDADDLEFDDLLIDEDPEDLGYEDEDEDLDLDPDFDFDFDLPDLD